MARIRPISICLIEKKDHLLVQEFWDEERNRHYYRPPGGGIEFGETALAAVHREIMEELRVEICEANQIHVLENFFPFNGELKHEVVFVFEAKFKEEVNYRKKRFHIVEPGFQDTYAIWKPIQELLSEKVKLYPKSLKAKWRHLAGE